MEQLINIGNLAVSWALFGLIWTIQLLHYPSFRYVDDFSNFHQHHMASITLIVAPLMLLELAFSLYVAWQKEWTMAYVMPLLLVIAIWLLTFLWAVPLHEKLSRGSSDVLISQLIVANWPRTILWTLKAMWLSYLQL